MIATKYILMRGYSTPWIFVILLMGWIGQLNAQSILYTYNTTGIHNERVQTIEEWDDSHLVVFSTVSIPDTTNGLPINGIAQRIMDRNYNLVRETIIFNDSLDLNLTDAKWGMDSSYFILVGHADIRSLEDWNNARPYPGYFCAMRINRDFELEKLTLVHKLDSMAAGRFALRAVMDSLFIGACYYYPKRELHYFTRDYIYLINPQAQFKILKEYRQKSSKYRLISDIIRNQNGKGYVGFGAFVHYYDDSLNLQYLDTSQKMTELYFHQGHVFPLSSGSVIAGGSAGGDHVSFYKFDSNNRLIAQKSIHLKIPYQFMGDARCIDSYNERVYYSAQILYWGEKGISVISLDSSLQIRWIKYFIPVGDEVGTFLVSDVKAVKDGTCYIGGSIYRAVPNKTAFLMHINSEGEFETVATRNPGKRESVDITIYPNPSSGDMMVRYEGGQKPLKLVLSDINTHHIVTKVIYKGENCWQFPNLASGIYVYTLYSSEGKIIDTGRWAKR